MTTRPQRGQAGRWMRVAPAAQSASIKNPEQHKDKLIARLTKLGYKVTVEPIENAATAA